MRQSAKDEHEESGSRIVRPLAEMSAGHTAIDSALAAYNSRITYLRDEATHDNYEINKTVHV